MGKKQRRRAKSKSGKTKNNALNTLVEKFVALMEGGELPPWAQPWKGGARINVPQNADGRPYRGINVFVLALTAMAQGYDDPVWLTYRAAQKRGGHVRKGEKGTQVVFWKTLLVDDETGELVRDTDSDAATKDVRRIPYARTYTVFNRQQCEDVEEAIEDAALASVEALPEPQAVIDAYLEAEGLQLDHTKFYGASYKPSVDRIVLPQPSRFEDMAHYYMTAFHELAHSTSHADRVDCKLDTQFGSHSYGVEELTAEMSAAMLGTHTGLTSESGVVENSAAYLKGWLEKIHEDPNIVWVAAQRAQKVVDYIMGTCEEPTVVAAPAPVPEQVEAVPVSVVEADAPAAAEAELPTVPSKPTQPSLLPAGAVAARAVH